MDQAVLRPSRKVLVDLPPAVRMKPRAKFNQNVDPPEV